LSNYNKIDNAIDEALAVVKYKCQTETLGKKPRRKK